MNQFVELIFLLKNGINYFFDKIKNTTVIRDTRNHPLIQDGGQPAKG